MNASRSKITPQSTNKVSEPIALTDFRKALMADTAVAALWNNLTPIARRDFMSWIDSAKQPETRKRRIERVGSMLTAGKRRPCCYAVVPMNLYKALAAHTKAKTQWRALTPAARRDFIGWIDSAKQSETHQLRIEKVCVMLAAGKRRP